MKPPTPTKTAAAIQRDGRVSIRFIRLFARLDLPDEVLIDQDRPTLAAANHRSLLDVFCAAALCGNAGISCRFLVQARYFDQPVVGRWLRRIGCIPLNTKTKQSAFDTATASLERGELVGIMPEGRLVPPEDRDGQVGQARPGVGELVARTNAWIQPVIFHNTEVVWRRGGLPRPRLRRPTVTLALGEPIDVAELARRDPQAAADQIMEALAGELDRLDAADQAKR